MVEILKVKYFSVLNIVYSLYGLKLSEYLIENTEKLPKIIYAKQKVQEQTCNLHNHIW